MDSNYCAEQIIVPENLPNLLKDFIKSSIIERPDDILVWAVNYFKDLNEGKRNGGDNSKEIGNKISVKLIFLLR